MDRTPTEDAVKLLTRQIETSIGRPVVTARDFTFLRECIFARLHIYLSESTLKRVWGYLPRGETRPYTLSVLASFLGYGSWSEYLSHSSAGEENTSSYIIGRHLCVNEGLEPGVRIELVWKPDRRCVVAYLGDNRFRVVESENTRLKSGDTFSCGFFIEGEPLYLNALEQAGREPVSYVCGKISGIRFQILPSGGA